MPRRCTAQFVRRQTRALHKLLETAELVSASRMILALGVSLELLGIEVNIPQAARRISLGFVIEVRRFRIARFPASRNRFGPHSFAEFHYSDKAIPAGAVPLLR